MAGEPGCRLQAFVSWVLFEGNLLPLLLDGPYGGEKKQFTYIKKVLSCSVESLLSFFTFHISVHLYLRQLRPKWNANSVLFLYPFLPEWYHSQTAASGPQLALERAFPPAYRTRDTG